MLLNDPFDTLQSPLRLDLSPTKPLLIVAKGAAVPAILLPMSRVDPLRR